MKKCCIIFILLFIIILTAAVFAGGGEGTDVETADYFRIHIRADSNDADDQAVKYLVRDALVEYLTPVLAECGDKSGAVAAVKGRLSVIEAVADGVLKENGFSYTASAAVTSEEFPSRVYEEVTLPAGVYDSLIVRLGSGAGDNWWCVVYPPLCFATDDVVYKSKIAEIIQNFFG